MWATVCGSDSVLVKPNLGLIGSYPQDGKSVAHSQVDDRGGRNHGDFRRPDSLSRSVRASCPDGGRDAMSTIGILKQMASRSRELGFGIGIAYGYARLGAIGFEGRSEYGATGTVVNLAARLCAEARDGPANEKPRAQEVGPARGKGFFSREVVH